LILFWMSLLFADGADGVASAVAETGGVHGVEWKARGKSLGAERDDEKRHAIERECNFRIICTWWSNYDLKSLLRANLIFEGLLGSDSRWIFPA